MTLPAALPATATKTLMTAKLKVSTDTHGKDNNVDSGMTIDVVKDCERPMMSQTSQ